jgi:hypothetical protein
MWKFAANAIVCLDLVKMINAVLALMFNDILLSFGIGCSICNVPCIEACPASALFASGAGD